MLYLSGVVRSDMPAMLTARMGQRPPDGQPWAADNGRFSAPQNYTDTRYLGWLAKMPRESCLFATAPDVVGDAAATLALSAPMFAPIRALGYRVAFVGQDGQEHLPVPWDDFDALFIGGTTDWKLGEGARELAGEAKRRGKWVHMGRVNSLRRMRYAESIGCDSADGTVLKHDVSRPAHEWGPRVAREPSLWGSPDDAARWAGG
jgi:hypothetical protein